MAREIVWAKRADKKYILILEYLNQEWGKDVTEAFIQRTYAFLDILVDFPEIGPIQNPDRNIRGFTLTKQTTIFYRLDNNKIILLNFFNNRQRKARK